MELEPTLVQEFLKTSRTNLADHEEELENEGFKFSGIKEKVNKKDHQWKLHQ